MKMTYPPRAPRVVRMDLGYTPQGWGKRKIQRLQVWKEKGDQAFATDLRHASRENPKGHHETTAGRGEFYKGQNKPIQDKGVTYVMKMSLFDFQSWAAPPNNHFHRSTRPGRKYQTGNIFKTVDSWNKNLVGIQSLLKDSHWVLKVPWEVQKPST